MDNKIKNSIGIDDHKIYLELEVIIYKENDNDKYFISFCPALNLSSFGITEKDAEESFNEALEIFMDDIISKNNLEKVLISLGWIIKENSFMPPRIDLPKIVNEYKPVKAERLTYPVCYA